MAVRKVNYCYVKVPNRPGQGAAVLRVLRESGVNLVAYSGFPGKTGSSQVDLVPVKMSALRQVARKQGWRLSKVKKGFVIQATDTVGAVHRHIQKLADARINIVAAAGVAAGKRRYGMILWVRPKDYARASRALGAR